MGYKFVTRPVDEYRFEFYDENEIRSMWKDAFEDICDAYGIGFLAEHLGVEEATIRSWKSSKGKMPGKHRVVWIHRRLSEIKVNSLLTNVTLAACFRIQEVDDFRVHGDGDVGPECMDLLRLAGRIADAAAQRDGEAGLRLMDVWETLGKRFRGDFEAMIAAKRTE